jgi:hypothetical protein
MTSGGGGYHRALRPELEVRVEVYAGDEIGMEVSKYTIPDTLAATPPKYIAAYKARKDEGIQVSQTFGDVHLIGAIEGWLAGVDPDRSADGYSAFLDDEEYPAQRIIARQSDGTVNLQARFGRDKRYALAVNRANPDAAREWIQMWLDRIGRE